VRLKRDASCYAKKITILLIGVYFCFGIDSYAQNYIPESSESKETAEVILGYSFQHGANRPRAQFKFKDGFEINLNAVCEGEYAWCIRVYEDDRIIDLGSAKIEVDDNQNRVIVKTKSDNNSKYKRYLDVLPGIYKRVR
jgi:hypothetical protein